MSDPQTNKINRVNMTSPNHPTHPEIPEGLTPMPTIDLHLDGDNCWPDLAKKKDDAQIIHLGNGAPPIGLAVLSGGMTSGRASVMFRLDLPDGRVVLAETSLVLLQTALRCILARYPEEIQP